MPIDSRSNFMLDRWRRILSYPYKFKPKLKDIIKAKDKIDEIKSRMANKVFVYKLLNPSSIKLDGNNIDYLIHENNIYDIGPI